MLHSKPNARGRLLLNTAMYQVEEINRIEDLAALRLPWQWLLGQTPGATFFQSLDWLEVYWRHFSEGQRLRVLVVYSHDHPLGILPLVVCPEQTRVGSLRVLTYPLEDWGTFYGPIGPQPTATLLAGLRHIGRTLRDWDVLDLCWANPHTDRGRTPRAMRACGFPPHTDLRSQVALIDVRGGWKPYWASRTSRCRKNLRRAEKRLAASGEVTYEHYRPAGIARGEAAPRWDLYDACEYVARRSWQADVETGTTLCHASVRDFLRDVHQAAVRVGAVDLHLLRLTGQPVAFAYNYHLHGDVSGLRTGYDAELSRDGAGTVLMRRTIETSFRLGDHTYDLGAGYLTGKRYWLTQLTPCERHRHYPLAVPRAQLLRLKRVLDQWLGRVARPETRLDSL